MTKPKIEDQKKKEEWEKRLFELAEKYCHHDDRELNNCLYYIFKPFIQTQKFQSYLQGKKETETRLLNEFQDTEMKWLRQLRECKQQTLTEVLEVLPKRTDKDFNLTVIKIRELLEKLK